MRNWDTRDESGTDSGCEWKKDWEDVQRVCRRLGLKCEMVSFQGIYVLLYLMSTLGGPFSRILDPRFRACVGTMGGWFYPKPGHLV